MKKSSAGWETELRLESEHEHTKRAIYFTRVMTTCYIHFRITLVQFYYYYFQFVIIQETYCLHRQQKQWTKEPVANNKPCSRKH